MAGPHEPCSPWWAFARILFFLAFSFSRFSLTTAQPATIQYSDCFSSDNTSQKVDISTVYAQFFPDSPKGAYLNFTVIGSTPQQILAASDGQNPVASEYRNISPGHHHSDVNAQPAQRPSSRPPKY